MYDNFHFFNYTLNASNLWRLTLIVENTLCQKSSVTIIWREGFEDCYYITKMSLFSEQKQHHNILYINIKTNPIKTTF